jgi:hypothetical protein
VADATAKDHMHDPPKLKIKTWNVAGEDSGDRPAPGGACHVIPPPTALTRGIYWCVELTTNYH